ncbi:uncharacterized protein LOC118348769 isoform X2 [Juglans regia]|uniref:Uncharacterized protein LOC118348769 isoform X2 n=1 Tax=Juglans regia TaxID=51240 RepID=A0A6P9EI04_JUGRE|nr:uncharacterized protein LOC118348769 isoform X2 [Juglans regia]
MKAIDCHHRNTRNSTAEHRRQSESPPLVIVRFSIFPSDLAWRLGREIRLRIKIIYCTKVSDFPRFAAATQTKLLELLGKLKQEDRPEQNWHPEQTRQSDPTRV